MLTRGKELSIATFLRKSQCGLTHDRTPKVCCPQYEIQHSGTSVSPTERPVQNFGSGTTECGRTIRKGAVKIVGGYNASLGTVYVQYFLHLVDNVPIYECV